ncbi:conjugal transfer protein TrbD [Vibrio parahaemolyticus]|jgi:type IV secretion system protein VirB3|uniref:conjugal transfer protein TrbD n=1 Tax=Vibrio harveyi group TaxID=717610 RepID=UPI00084B8F4C|nr:conjugal transfer protein TrbD [Vibrio parahaemolyticus]OEB90885.1 conjugal transfer protein TrbD [Vibrio parahaemolyticus]
MSEPLKHVRVFRFNRSHLFLGGERELVLITALFCLVLIVILQDAIAAIVGVILWSVLIPIYRRMASTDPRMTKVYQNYARYQSFYPAHGMKHHGKFK